MNKICILSLGRTGSTLFISLLQKSNAKVLALSEVDEPNYIKYHYDVVGEKGVLNKFKDKIKKIDNYQKYVEQFIKIAEESDKDTFIFKITARGNNEQAFKNLKRKINILTKIGFKFVLLNRNYIDIFISDKKAKKSGSFSNFDYSELKVNFTLQELKNSIDYCNSIILWFITNVPNIHYVKYEELFKELDSEDQLNNVLKVIKKLFPKFNTNKIKLNFKEELIKKQNNKDNSNYEFII